MFTVYTMDWTMSLGRNFYETLQDKREMSTLKETAVRKDSKTYQTYNV